MKAIEELYIIFLSYFPVWFQPVISIVLAVILVVSAFQVVKRNFIFLIALVVLLPASIPILSRVLDTLVAPATWVG
jgi:hypothetical protein